MKTRIHLFLLFTLAVCFALSLNIWAEYVSGYTVEFTYGDNQYVLGSGDSVQLSEILDELGLTGEVTAVTVSDPDLFSASDDNGEYIVSSHKPFDSAEYMTVTIGRDEYEIAVTDATGELYYVGANGQDVLLTEWFHIENKDVNNSDFKWNDNDYCEYAVTDKNVVYNRRIDVKDGDSVILILCDGCTLTINGGIHVGSNSSLSIFCQKGGTGKLIVDNVADYYAGIGGNSGHSDFADGKEGAGDCGTVKIYGGTVTSVGGWDGAAIGGGICGSGGTIEIFGGTVTAACDKSNNTNEEHYGSAGIGGGILGSGKKSAYTAAQSKLSAIMAQVSAAEMTAAMAVRSLSPAVRSQQSAATTTRVSAAELGAKAPMSRSPAARSLPAQQVISVRQSATVEKLSTPANLCWETRQTENT